MAKRAAVRQIKLTIPADPSAHVAGLAEELQKEVAAQRELDRDAYADIEHERNHTERDAVKTIAGVLMGAVGTCEWDPVLALLQEISLRLRTLQAAVDGEDYDSADLRLEMYMLEQRADAVRELVRRLHPQVQSYAIAKGGA